MEQWALVEPLMPSAPGAGRPFQDHQTVVEGIVYRYRTGVAWRDVPACFGPWQTVWKRHRQFSGDSTRDAILTALLGTAEAAGLIDGEVSVNSNRTHRHATDLTPSTGGPGERTT